MGLAHRSNWRERALAILIAGLLTLAWSIADRGQLAALILPDPDDVMRLAQIRDWLGGQGFSDLTQYRLGSGLAMHWSRLPDLVPAALILLLEPLVGRHGAEVAAVIAWPALLFAATLALLGSCARLLAPGQRSAGFVAIILGGLAYPATGFFTPGRIDHHGLQLLLLLVAARTMLAVPSARAGGAAGVAIAASLAIGLESAPLCAIVLAVLVLRWAIDGRGAALTATGLTLAGGAMLAALLLAPRIWPAGLCDAFTPPVAWLAMLAGGLLAVVGLARPFLASPIRRFAALGVAGVTLIATLPFIAPACLGGPYGALPPLLRILWLEHVAEAQPLLGTPASVVLGYAGLMFAGLAVGAVRLARGERNPAALGWQGLLAGAALLACIQLRLAPFGAALAVPVLAGLIVRARASARPLAAAGAWAVSAGILYPLAAGALPSGDPEPPRTPCLTPANLQRVAALDAARIAVPLDMGAYVLTSSQARVLAAPYHRNGAANVAHYRLFLARPEIAAAEARRWQLDAITYCPDWLADLDPLGIAAPGSIVALAKQGRVPAWAGPLTVGRGLVVVKPRR